ncbi:hexose carrier protein HEX6-like [Andrographis paniculata]|uniref:hexose carrier protein HEX6-like n=1 Tax=Andrographis paniculata TaxID=175694 RepID=UPI0021E896D4|nr:hexose carrier protein HEX6-like [Andrographis paniculata]
MAVGVSVQSQTHDGGRRYNGGVTSYVLLSCLVAASGGIIFGYDIGVSGGVSSMDPFLKKFFPGVYKKMREDTKISNYCKFDSQLLTTFTSSLYLAGLISSFLAAVVTRDYGRRPSIIVGGVAYMAGAAVGGAAVNIYMLILGRILLGIGLGFANQSVPLYLSEMAPSQYRGAFNIAFQVCLTIGYNMATLINYTTAKISGGWGWRVSVSAAGVPAAMLGFGALFLPETPNSLVQHRKNADEAREGLKKIRGTDDVQDELDDLVEASYASKAIKHPFKNLLRQKYRPQLVMSIAIPFFQQLTGINVIGFYAPILFLTLGSGENMSLLSAILTGLVGSIFTLLAVVLVDRVGRRPLFHAGGVQMLVALILIGGVMAGKLGDHNVVDKGYAWAVVILICVYLLGFGLSWGPLTWVVTSEIFPLEIRSAAQSVVVAVSLFMTFVIAQTLLAMLCHMKSGLFFFFGASVLVMSVFEYYMIPETKGIPIEKMGKIWREHFFWKRFVGNAYEDDKT